MTVVASKYARAENDKELAETLMRRLRYDRMSGVLIWNERSPSDFVAGKYSAERICQRWNTRFAGKQAGYRGADGYWRINIGPKSFLLHRVAWLISNGSWPNDQLDHEDQDEGNNRLGNLREATNSQNAKNKPLQANNKTGYAGVVARADKWVANIKVDGKRTHLGTFPNFDDAVAARLTAAKAAGFSPKHGVQNR
ncbi:hypothetical protein BMW22_15790 [Rhizobium leguminosarum]|uniref:HNH nuclease domain-containing protein n=1 Tax=Rhizobium leguminosarum TaxID=384 RepID=A0A1L3ZB94_RHILE|nr:HNH endonuclease signature motif containing protein [Rhizobium leguminosarum]API52887.1 hypothetical protein BMW22_15790 [Rhizobium leguminosarum]